MTNTQEAVLEFTTTHRLAFEVGYWIMPDFDRFRVGTVEGLWTFNEESYQILALDNSKPHNGHLQDVFEYFEHSCKRDNRNLMVLEVWNERFKRHLIEKRGFVVVPGTDHVIKRFQQ